MNMRSIILGVLFAAIVGSACDCKGSGGKLEPSDVRAADLYGWWTATDESGSVTVFGFFPKEDAATELPISPEEATADVSAVYQGPRGALGEPAQLATFEVKDGEILETVLRGARATPGAQLRTRILGLTPQRELTLQSSSASSGSRAFSWAARCPSAKPNGIFDVQGQICSTRYSGGTSLVVDAQGVVHAASGLPGIVDACPAGKPAGSTYSRFESACGPALNVLPNFRESGMAADASTLHLAYEAFTPGDASRNYHLFYASRSLGPRGDWTEEPVAGILASGHPVYDIRVLVRDGQSLIVASYTDGTLRVYRREGGAWSVMPTLLPDGTPVTGWTADATLDREGRMVLLLESNHQIALERAGGFELIRLPKRGMAAGFGGGVATDGSGRIHVTYVYEEIGDNADGTGGWVISGRGIYGVYDGTAWTSHELGPVTYPRMATHGDGPWRVVHGLGKARRSTLALTEVSRDGSLRSELINFERTGGGTSPEPVYDTVAAAGPEGTIAASWDGTRVYIRPPEDQIVRERKTITFSFEGKGGGRVRSADGTIDCTATCTVEVPVGSRHQLFFEADAQSAIDQIPCVAPYMSLYGYCWYDVFPEEQGPIIVKFRETPVVSVTAVADGNSNLTRLGARDGRVVMAATTNAGRFPIGDAVVDVGVLGDMIAVRETDGRVWGAPLPATPLTVGLRSDGSASALFFADRALSFPSGTVGSASAPVVVLAHYAGGSFQRLERLADVPSSTRLLAAAVGDDDTAAVVLSSTDGFGSLGVPEWNLLVYRNASGSVVLRGLEAGAAAGGIAGLTLGEGRAVVLLPNPFNDAVLYKLSFLDGGALVGSQTVNGVALASYALKGDRLFSIWGPANSTSYLYLEHGMDGRQLVSRPLTLEVAGVSFAALAPAPAGTIFVRPSFRSGLEYARLGDPSYSFLFGGDHLGNKATPRMSDSDGRHFWIAVENRGTVDYDVTTVENTYRTLLLQMRLP
jgi:hypothetical protein